MLTRNRPRRQYAISSSLVVSLLAAQLIRFAMLVFQTYSRPDCRSRASRSIFVMIDMSGASSALVPRDCNGYLRGRHSRRRTFDTKQPFLCEFRSPVCDHVILVRLASASGARTLILTPAVVSYACETGIFLYTRAYIIFTPLGTCRSISTGITFLSLGDMSRLNACYVKETGP
jgi:hypothetical protein